MPCSDMLISAQHIGGTESFLIDIEASKVQGLLAQFDGDLNLMAKHLKLMENKMCLLNPVSIGIWSLTTQKFSLEDQVRETRSEGQHELSHEEEKAQAVTE